MKTVKRGVAALFVAVFVLVGAGTGPAFAIDEQGSAPDNSAIAINTTDGSSLFKLAFSVAWATGDTVNNANTAIAYASCSNCTTVAIAIQIVFVVGSPSVFTPQNVAIAVNENCHACNTLAMAYQLVVQVSGPVRLTPEGLRQLRDIRSQLQALRELSMTIAQMHDKVLALEQQLQQVMTTQLVRVKGDEQHGAQGDNPSSTSTTSTTFGATTNGSLSTTTAPVRTTSTSTSTTTTTTTSSTSTTSSSTTATSKP